jgi:hypothetical protein
VLFVKNSFKKFLSFFFAFFGTPTMNGPFKPKYHKTSYPKKNLKVKTNGPTHGQ